MSGKMNLDTRIHLNKFKPRDYQIPLCDALENQGMRRMVICWPRRAGKDYCCWNLTIRAAIREVGVYFYIFPTFSQAKRVIWDSITNDGQRFVDFIPKELIAATSSQELKITLTNGSIIQLVGWDNIDRLMGTNPKGIVFSEYAMPKASIAYTYLRPILVANKGWSIFESTPRGRNHFYELFQIASNSDEWFSQKLTVHDTKHISLFDIEKEKADGLISEDNIQQEYFTSFDMGIQGAFYAKYMDLVRFEERMGHVPWESSFPVYTSWDIGVRDATSIIFYQIVGQVIRIIDTYENTNTGLEHYVQLISSKPYQYAKHFAPHDISVREWGSGLSRLEKASQLGLKFEFIADAQGRRRSAIPNLSIDDGIEAVRSSLGKMWFDHEKCQPLIKALENYRQVWDKNLNKYTGVPLHDDASHFADAFRYLVLSLPQSRDSSSPKDLQERINKARYGHTNNLPDFFR